MRCKGSVIRAFVGKAQSRYPRLVSDVCLSSRHHCANGCRGLVPAMTPHACASPGAIGLSGAMQLKREVRERDDRCV